MGCCWNKIANKQREGRSACAVQAAGTTMQAQIIAGVICFIILLHCRGYSSGTFAALLTITIFLIKILTVRNKTMFKRRLFLGVLSSREGDDPLAGRRHNSTMTSEVGVELRPPPAKRVHCEASYAKTTDRASPSCTTSTRGNGPFEEAITRLAGVVELGTEPLIYVRRKDVAKVVDAFVHSTETPGGMSIASPALARLAIVRRSSGEDSREQKYAFSPEFRSARGDKRSTSAGRGRSSPAMSPSACRARMMKGRTLFGQHFPPERTEASGSLKYRPTTPASGAKPPDLKNSTGLPGGHEDAHCIWQQIIRQASSAAASKPPSPKTPTAWAINASANGASKMASASRAESKKINCVSDFSARDTGKEAAFADFWSTGWG